MKKTFALIGAAGYIAPRHMKAIKEVGGDLVAAYDPCDSVGVLDKWFPKCKFFTSINDLERECLVEHGIIDYVVICSPNYMHHIHSHVAVKFAKSIICEKPIVINPAHLDGIIRDQLKFSLKVNTILQLRLHPDVKIIKKVIGSQDEYNCFLTYHTPRGNWYQGSWKGDAEKSGGILMNIGIHMFDLMIHLFGEPIGYETGFIEDDTARGKIIFNKAVVNYDLSTRPDNKPMRRLEIGTYTHDFEGFEDLHTESYREILAGRGFGIEDARPSIELVNKIRNGQRL